MLAQKIDNEISELEASLLKEKNNKFYDNEEEHQRLIKEYEMRLSIIYLIRGTFVNYCTSEDHINEFNIEDSVEIRITKISEETEIQLLNNMVWQRQNNINAIEYSIKEKRPINIDILNEELEKNKYEISVIKEFLPENE